MASELNVQVLIGLRDQLSAPLRGVLSRLDSSADALNAKLGRLASLTFIGGALQQIMVNLFVPTRFSLE